jgi:hypothetical protein
MTPRRFFVDRFQISFLKLRILTFPFSKDANWIIGAFHGCSPRIGMERTILQDDKKNWASARPSYSRHFDTCRSVDKRSSSQPGRNQAANCKTLLIRTFLDVPDINLIWHIGCCSMMRNAITEVRTILSTRPEDSESQSGRSATAARERQRHLLIPRWRDLVCFWYPQARLAPIAKARMSSSLLFFVELLIAGSRAAGGAGSI